MTACLLGGAMTWRLTCKHADVLASVAPTAAANAKEWGAVMPPFDLDCRFDLYDSPPAELPILHMHGTIDGLVPFAKGEMQRDAVIEKWSMVQQEVVSESNGHRHTRYVNPNGTVYEFIQHDYHATTGIAPVALIGHCFPGGKDWNTNPSPGELLFFGCEQPNAFVWAELAMQFFLEHPKE